MHLMLRYLIRDISMWPEWMRMILRIQIDCVNNLNILSLQKMKLLVRQFV